MRNKKNVAISLAVVAAVIVAAYLGRVAPSAAVAVDPLTVVPRDATSIARIDLRHLLESKLWRKLVVDTGGDRGLRELRQNCGYDPLANAHDLVIFVLGDGDEPMAHVGFVLRGHFDMERLATCVGHALHEDGSRLRRTELAGLPAVAGERGDSRFAFVGQEAILGGSEATVVRIADTIAGRAPSAATGPLAANFRDLYANADSVLVAQPPASWAGMLRQGVNSILPGVGESLATPPLVALGVRHRQDMAVDLRVMFDSAASADDAETAIQQTLGATRLHLGLQAMGLSGLVPALHVGHRGAQFRLNLALEGALLDRALDLIAQNLRRPPPATPDTEYNDRRVKPTLDAPPQP